MKKIKIGTIIIFIVLLFIPILKFNWKENVVSEIDNRTLTNNPLGPNYQPENDDDDLTDALDNYLQDRIGFRDQMIYYIQWLMINYLIKWFIQHTHMVKMDMYSLMQRDNLSLMSIMLHSLI